MLGYARRINTHQIASSATFVFSPRVSLSMRHIFVKGPSTEGKWHLTGARYALSYTSRQQCWGFTLSYATRDFGGDIISFQINITGIGEWGRRESI